MRTKAMRMSVFVVGFCALHGLLWAAAPQKEGKAGKTPATDEPKAKPKPGEEATSTEPKAPAKTREDAVAKVDDLVITRADLNGARRLFALINPQAVLNNKQLLEQLINRILWSRHFEKAGLRPSREELQQVVNQVQEELRRQNVAYQSFLDARGMSVQDHLNILGYDISMRKVMNGIEERIKPAEIKAEYDAHPDWYDGSRVRLSQIFVDTSSIAQDPKELEKAKQRVDQVYAQLVAGRDFDRIAGDYSDGVGTGMAGDRGWFVRKGADVEDPLIAAVWDLKVNDFTKPIAGPRGWHVLKVTDREPAALTFHGCRPRIVNDLTRRRLEALLEELRAAAKIETYL